MSSRPTMKRRSTSCANNANHLTRASASCERMVRSSTVATQLNSNASPVNSKRFRNHSIRSDARRASTPCSCRIIAISSRSDNSSYLELVSSSYFFIKISLKLLCASIAVVFKQYLCHQPSNFLRDLSYTTLR